jgi:hypothetical protein
MVKTISVGEILNPKEMKEALKLYAKSETGQFAERCAAEIIRPVIERINKSTGQKNDPKYLAYCVEYAIMKSKNQLHS